MSALAAEPLLTVTDLVKHYTVSTGLSLTGGRAMLRAVDGISFTLNARETLSLVGESGSGKTTTAKLVLGLERPTAGTVEFHGRNIHALTGRDTRDFRVAVQAVFQDPWSSLNPRLRIGEIVAEPLIINQALRGKRLQTRVDELLVAVGLGTDQSAKYPHELSGGMRQRVSVARALALNPPLIVLDEPVSALDVSIRAQIMNLLKDLQEQQQIAYFLIAHDLATVRYLSHRVAVMYLGQIVEIGDSEALFARPLHPYTQALISASLPVAPGQADEALVLSDDIPSPIAPPSGCRFHTRCPFAFDRCSKDVPVLKPYAADHLAACHLY